MRTKKERESLRAIAVQFHRERIILNNPLVMQGMGLAPLIVVATTGINAAMLALAVAMLLIPTRVLCSLLLKDVRNLFYRAMGYCVVAAVVYIGMYAALEHIFGTQILLLGIYLPMLVVEPLIIYRFGRVAEPVKKAILKGIRSTIGYALVVVLVGCTREILAVGTVFSFEIFAWELMPLAALPAGGFIVVGTICAIWRSLVEKYHRQQVMEAKGER